jgi:DNA-binding NarL/FixJ family response regulator
VIDNAAFWRPLGWGISNGNYKMQFSRDQVSNRSIRSVFVGSPLSFSDTALKLIESELPYMECVRTAAVNDLFLMGPNQSASVRLIVVDESAMGNLIARLTGLRAAFPMTTIALGFRQTANARTLMTQMQSNPSWGKIGFLPMDKNLDCWLSVVRLLASGECYVPAGLFFEDGLLPVPSVHIPSSAPETETAAVDDREDVNLTERELQVLKHAAQGQQNKIIADAMKLSQHTVKLHMHHIIAKLGVSNRTEAANWYHGRTRKSKEDS